MTQSQADSQVVEQEMLTIIFYLTAIGHIDGDFDQSERDYVLQFIEKLVSYRARLALKDASSEEKQALAERWTKRFKSAFETIDQRIQGLFTESVGDGENIESFVHAKLKLRCYELFRQFPKDNQAKLLEIADELIEADGKVHPAEASFRKELQELLTEKSQPRTIRGFDQSDVVKIEVMPMVEVKPPRLDNYDFFQEFEKDYATTPEEFAPQAKRDLTLIEKTIALWDKQRKAGAGRLDGVTNVGELRGSEPFMDGHTYVHPVQENEDSELLVLGDLHGCYSCLKAALMQVDFFAKVDKHHLDPKNNPAMKLVMLGDYIDRGKYSYNGILRTIMQLFLRIPEHVYILRGNHEFYVELNGRIYGGVKPAEAINSLTGIAEQEVFVAYKRLFDSMPNALIYDQTLFAHAGIPRADTQQEKWEDLSSLNDRHIRFQMLWSDPSEADYIPLDLQKASARFPFGKRQFREFLSKLGCTTMFRGHERVKEGFREVYSDKHARLFNLFSAGGFANDDLPQTSNYRQVTPAAVSIVRKGTTATVTPFLLDWERYNRPELNGFVKR